MNEIIDYISEQLMQLFATQYPDLVGTVGAPTAAFYGLARPIYSQAEKGQRLFLAGDGGELSMVTLDSSLNWQSVHVLGTARLNRNASRTFGTIADNRFDVSLTLIVLATIPRLNDFVWSSFGYSSRLTVEGIDTDAERLLKQYGLVNIGQDQNYPPGLSAVAIRYTLTDVAQDELAVLNQLPTLTFTPVMIPPLLP